VVGQPRSWGRRHREEQRLLFPSSTAAAARLLAETGPFLPYGQGRSYGDSCLNDDGALLASGRLDHLVAFDLERGILTCEAGVTLAAIIAVLGSRPLPDGGYWALPVVPGTKNVSVGGAIANDVHGKNHESAGTFGRHVLSFDLLRSDRGVLRCSPDVEPELYCATIGGLGLTGMVLAATFKLVRVPGLLMETYDRRLENLDQYFSATSDDAERSYRAAWVDVTASGKAIGRGIHSASRWVEGAPPPPKGAGPAIPVEAPAIAMSTWPVKSFNALYRRKLGMVSERLSRSPMDPVLFPLDGLSHWNRLYGKRGFYQHQSVVPREIAADATRALLTEIGRSGEGSALTVLKEFGDLESPGLLSFPMAGTTLAVDFQDRGGSTLALLERLDAIVREAGGRRYPAKDDRMTMADFDTSFPAFDRFRQSVDPRFSSNFWRRVTA